MNNPLNSFSEVSHKKEALVQPPFFFYYLFPSVTADRHDFFKIQEILPDSLLIVSLLEHLYAAPDYGAHLLNGFLFIAGADVFKKLVIHF